MKAPDRKILQNVKATLKFMEFEKPAPKPNLVKTVSAPAPALNKAISVSEKAPVPAATTVSVKLESVPETT